MKKLETSRLILRDWQKSDVNDLFDIMKDPYVCIGGWNPHSTIEISNDVLKEYIESSDRWAIELRESKKVIGCIRLYPDNNRGKLKAKMMNFVLNKNYQGNGYMTEAVKRVVKYVFEDLDIELLSAFHYPENIKSKKFLKIAVLSMRQLYLRVVQGLTEKDLTLFAIVCVNPDEKQRYNRTAPPWRCCYLIPYSDINAL